MPTRLPPYWYSQSLQAGQQATAALPFPFAVQSVRLAGHAVAFPPVLGHRVKGFEFPFAEHAPGVMG